MKDATLTDEQKRMAEFDALAILLDFHLDSSHDAVDLRRLAENMMWLYEAMGEIQYRTPDLINYIRLMNFHNLLRMG